MAFTVEDGSGIVEANAYVPVAFADDHHADRGNSVWTSYDTATKQAAIIRATDYIDKRFGRKFRGFRKTLQQRLQWPRLSAFDDSGYLLGGDGLLPDKLMRACAEYALRAAFYTVLSPDPILPAPQQSFEDGAPARGEAITGTVSRKVTRVGPVEEETSYETPAMSTSRRIGTDGNRSVQSSLVNDFTIPEYPEADMWLEELMVSSTIAARLARGD